MKYRKPQDLKSSSKIKAFVSIIALALFIVSLYVGSFISFEYIVSRQIDAFNPSNQDMRHYGFIQPQVVDGFSEEPIEGASVVIPETGQQFITGQDGMTAIIKVPIKEDVHFAEISPKPWSEITLIIYKEGYVEYVLFHTHVWEDQTRQGPRIMLFPQVEGEKHEPFSVVEGPHRLWVKELVEKYRPGK